jgi:hypothetical protein
VNSGMIGRPVGSANGPAQSAHNESGLKCVSIIQVIHHEDVQYLFKSSPNKLRSIPDAIAA